METAAVLLSGQWAGSDVSQCGLVVCAAGCRCRLGIQEESVMSQAVTVKRIGERVRNKTGRVDVLASLLADEIVRQVKNPVLEAVHKTLMPGLVDPLLHYYLGPRNKHIRKVTRIVRTVVGEVKKQRAIRAGRQP